MHIQPVSIIYHPHYTMHVTGYGHPESPKRYSSVIDGLTRSGLMRSENSLLAKEAAFSAILRCHPQSYINLVEAECRSPGWGFLSTGDVKICPDSYAIALLAAGAGLVAIDAVMQKRQKLLFVS